MKDEKRNKGYRDNRKIYSAIFQWLKATIPLPKTELNYNSPFQLLVAVILSAQCTDKRINMISPALFKAFPTAQELAKATYDELFPYIQSVTYPSSKSKYLIGMAKMLCNNFAMQVPDTVDNLMKLPGVGRKTANVVASIIYNKDVIAVDTHVFRLAHRLGLSKGKTVTEVERDLMRIIPEKQRADSHHYLILHGRYTCTARNPKCQQCGLQEYCNYYKEAAKGVLK